MAHNSFAKPEHLYGGKLLGRLFAEGQSFIAYPLRVTCLLAPQEAGHPAVRVMVSVPKKRFKRAVKRNRLKRLMREAYRQNKHALCESLAAQGRQAHIAFQYIADEEREYAYIEKKMLKALQTTLEKVGQP